MNQRMAVVLLVTWLLGVGTVSAGGNPPEEDDSNMSDQERTAKAAPAPCQTLEENPIKIEGWINREHRKHHRAISSEFEEVQHTHASIKVFPMGATAKVVGVGRCVPAFIARHVLEKTLKYTGGIESLVNQAFLPTHWIGIGTTQFDEPSQQVITAEQVKALLSPDLSDDEFQILYRKFSIQDDTVKYFGRTTANAKKAQ